MLRVSVNIKQGEYILSEDDGKREIRIPINGDYESTNANSIRDSIRESREPRFIPKEKLNLIDAGVYKSLKQFDNQYGTNYAEKYVDITIEEIPKTGLSEKDRKWNARIAETKASEFANNGINVQYNISLFSAKGLSFKERIQAIRQAFLQKQNGIAVAFSSKKQPLLNAPAQQPILGSDDIPDMPDSKTLREMQKEDKAEAPTVKAPDFSMVKAPFHRDIPKTVAPQTDYEGQPNVQEDIAQATNQTPIDDVQRDIAQVVNQTLGDTEANVTHGDPMVEEFMKNPRRVQNEPLRPKKKISRSKARQASKVEKRLNDKKEYLAKLKEKAERNTKNREETKIADEIKKAGERRIAEERKQEELRKLREARDVMNNTPQTSVPGTTPTPMPTQVPQPAVNPIVDPIAPTPGVAVPQDIIIDPSVIGDENNNEQTVPKPRKIALIREGAKPQLGSFITRFTRKIKGEEDKIQKKEYKAYKGRDIKKKVILGAVTAVALSAVIALGINASRSNQNTYSPESPSPSSPTIVETMKPAPSETPSQAPSETPSQAPVETQTPSTQDPIKNEVQTPDDEEKDSKKEYLSSIKVGSAMDISSGKYFETPEGQGNYGNFENYANGIKEINMIDVMTEDGYIIVKDSDVNLYQLKQQYPNAKFAYHMVCKNPDGTTTVLGWLTESSLDQNLEQQSPTVDYDR